MRQLFFSFLLSGLTCLAQSSNPVLLSAGNVNPFPLSVAPGQVLTLFVQTGTILAPVTPSDVSAVFTAGGTNQTMPVLQVGQASTGCNGTSMAPCPQVLAVTVQIPFGIPVFCPLCATAFVIAESIAVSVSGVATTNVMVQAFQDQVHFLTSCDVIMAGPSSPVPVNGGLPCAAIVTHANGTTVSAIAPATAGEELVAYATGLGQTIPALTTGQPPAASSPTLTTFTIDYNYRVNALATQPGTVDSGNATPLFTGATKGYVGLYQINFIVPPPPPLLQPCVNSATAVITAGIAVQSNLTVSIGSPFSFAGAGICVRPTVGDDNTE
jgi:uncharacterized protein (TIGR03437 family)